VIDKHVLLSSQKVSHASSVDWVVELSRLEPGDLPLIAPDMHECVVGAGVGDCVVGADVGDCVVGTDVGDCVVGAGVGYCVVGAGVGELVGHSCMTLTHWAQSLQPQTDAKPVAGVTTPAGKSCNSCVVVSMGLPKEPEQSVVV